MNYKYRALNAEGGTVTGETSGATARDAIRALQKQGLRVVEIKEEKAKASGKRTSKKKASKQELVMYMHQLTTLLESKVSLEEAVESLAESSGQPFIAKEFEKIGAGLRRGENFSKALKSSLIPLPGYFYPLCEAGELTGKLGPALRDGVTQWEYDMEVATEMRNAMTYPMILIFTGIGAVMLIFAVVVPKFVNLLDKSKAEVPFLAQAVLRTGEFVNNNLIVISALAAGIVAIVVYGFANPEIRLKVRDFFSKVPMFREWLMESEIAHWSAMLATLLENRVELMRALELARSFVVSSQLQARLAHVSKSVKNGVHLSHSLQEAGAITPMGFNLIRVGERTGELAAMLRSMTALYTSSVRARTKRFLVLLEPLAIIMIGGVVGLIMAGIILAITSVNNISI